jgi:hypothetical protein
MNIRNARMRGEFSGDMRRRMAGTPAHVERAQRGGAHAGSPFHPQAMERAASGSRD